MWTTRLKNRRGPILVLIGVLLLLWLYVRESQLVLSTPFKSWDIDHSADCAVVLTGGPNRVREGFDLLAQGQVRKLIISGVNPRSGLRDIFPQIPFYGTINENNVILEKRSLTTYGNVQQTLALVEALRCRDLIVVTSKVHMYRATRTFSAAFPPNYPIIQHAVLTGSIQPDWDETLLEAAKSLFYSIWAY
jgi:uncharacterized SAM-binding protein YcdF (DUF218 family)